MVTDRLLPHSIAELCAHALELERVCERRFSGYAVQMRAIGERTVALALERMARGLRDDIAELAAGTGERKPATLTPWEYVWRLTYMPESLEDGPAVMPSTAREALQCAVQARRRAGIFYDDVAHNAGRAVVRACAAEMAAAKQLSLQRLERLLAQQILVRTGMASGRDKMPAWRRRASLVLWEPKSPG